MCRSKLWAASPMYINGERLSLIQDKVDSVATAATPGDNDGDPAVDDEIGNSNKVVKV